MTHPLMITLDPIAVALKFGFLAVLYLFVFWVARATLKDLRAAPSDDARVYSGHDDATGMQPAVRDSESDRSAPSQLRVVDSGLLYDLSQQVVLGRDDGASVRIDDPFASHHHARISPEGDVIVLEDLGSTNGTYLNGELIHGPQPLHPGDQVRIGDFELAVEQ